MLFAVLQRDLELAAQRRVDRRVKGQQVGQVALDLVLEQVGLVGLAALARLAGVVVLALPEAAGVVDDALLVGVEPGELAVLVLDALRLELLPVVVMDEELVGAAALHEVALLEQVRLHVVVGAVVALAREAARLDVHAHEEWGVRPLLGVDLVDEAVLHDDVQPRERQGAVGAGAQVLPVVGLLARAGQARVNADVRLGRTHLVNERAAGVVIVGVLRRGAPLHVNARSVLERHPRGTVD